MKPLPTMVLSTLYFGRARTRYTALEWAAAGVLGLGLADAITGGARSRTEHSALALAFGAALALASITADSFVSTFEQAKIFTRAAAPSLEFSPRRASRSTAGATPRRGPRSCTGRVCQHGSWGKACCDGHASRPT